MTSPRLKSPRLLPVVIAAIAALVLFKGIGLLTNGGYVLTGATPAVASGDAAAPETADAPAMQVPGDVTMTDAAPTLTDGAVTMPLGPDTTAAAHGTEAAPAEGDPAAASTGDAAAAATAADHGGTETAAAAQPAAAACPDAAGAQPAAQPAAPAGSAPAGAAANGGHGTSEDFAKGFDFVAPPVDCTPNPGVNAAGDALPLEMTGDGKKVPMTTMDAGAVDSTDEVLERLSDRRSELDKRQADLDMREALIEAAEKRIDQRTAELKALEAQVDALVKEKQTAEQQQFVAIVAMYEAMKPKDAAAIFDQLEMPVLLKVTRAMSPRKMAPILAAMSTTKAKDLTANLAADQGDQTVDIGQADTSQLPQIVGQ